MKCLTKRFIFLMSVICLVCRPWSELIITSCAMAAALLTATGLVNGEWQILAPNEPKPLNRLI